MRLIGKRTIQRIINYNFIRIGRLKRYLDHLRIGVASFPVNDHIKKATAELLLFIERDMPESLVGTIIMDIGCGDGYMLSQINKKHSNSSFIGISVCNDDISLARKRHGVKVKFGDMHSIPQNENTVDTILARHVLEHSPMPLFALFEMHRIMKKGKGILAVVLPAYDSKWVKYEGHFHCMPKDNWMKLFEESGFNVLFEETGCWFAVATNKLEKEWRFILSPKKDEQFCQPYKPFYADVFNRLILGLKRLFSK